MDTPIDAAIKKMEAAYDKVLKQCYEALAEDASQETRDALREAIAAKLGITTEGE
jgi:hypothetical protein